MIEQLNQAREILDRLLSLFEASEADKFAAHLFTTLAANIGTLASDRNKGNKAIERGYCEVPDCAEPRIQCGAGQRIASPEPARYQ